MNKLLSTVLISVLMCATSLAEDLEKKALDLYRPGWYVNGDLFAQYNSLGAVALLEATYNVPGKEKMNMVWSHVEAGAHLSVSPAATGVGIHGEWMPVALFRLRLMYDYLFFHGTFGSLMKLESSDVPHDEADMSKIGLGEYGTAHRMILYPVLQALYRGILFRNQNELIFYGVNTDAPYWFNWEIESITKQSDFVLTERVNLMYDLLVKTEARHLYMGPFYSLVWQPSTRFRRQRMGIDIYAEPFSANAKTVVPHFMLISGFNLEETYRKHEFVVILNAGINIDRRRGH